MKNKMVSIIIRSYNEEKWIGACLDAVFKQDYNNYEVILIDNKSTDHTVMKAEKYPVKILTIDDFLPGKAINVGIKASKGDYLVCLSAHCIPVNEKWLSNLLRNFDSDRAAGVYGRQEPMSFTSDTDKRDLLTVFGLDRKVQTKDSFFHNANSAIRRDVWERIPFDEKITNIEDRLWAKEVIKAAYQIVYDPEASVYHYHGIHQNQNSERCRNVVRILENLGTEDGYQFNHLDLEKLNITALVPVKGEILNLNGKPLLQYTIESAQESKYIKQVVISTDSDEHAALAEKYGASVPFMREKALSSEFIDLDQVYQYSISELEKTGIIPDIVVTMQVTFPFRPKGFIDELILRLVKEGLDSVIGVKAEFSSCWTKEDNLIKRIDGGDVPRKFKEPTLIGIEGLGCATYPIFLRAGHLLGDRVGVIEVLNPYSSIEVRDEHGMKFAGELIKRWQSER